jgi:hypothetical protein
MPPGDWRVTIRQGPRAFLRHNLRHNTANAGEAQGLWLSSKPLKATIAGQQHTAWLLESASSTALVVEVDDLLLHITSPDTAYLEGSVLAELSKLEWEQVEP